MANRFPLVFDAGTAKSIQELPTGDNLNLSGSSIVSAVNITATGSITVPTLNVTNINVNGGAIAAVATSNDYNDLTNLPQLFSGDYNDLTNKPGGGVVSYNDLTNKPVIATKISQLVNDVNFVTNAQINITSNQVTDLSAVATSGSFNDLTNVPNFVTNEQIVGGTLTVEVSNTGNLIGSVFADDSTLMVDHIRNEISALKLKTDVIESADFSLVATDRIYIKTPDFITIQSQSFEIYNDNSGTNISDQDVIRFNGNVNFSGANVTGLISSNITGDLKGSVFGDDSSVLVDAVNNVIQANTINGNIITATTLNSSAVSSDIGITITAGNGIQLLPSGIFNVPNATTVTFNASSAISLTATDDLTLTSTSGIVDFPSGTFVDFTGATVTGLTVLTGDVNGSVFGDDSTLLVDGINNTIPASVISGTFTEIDTSSITSNTNLTLDTVNLNLRASGVIQIGDTGSPSINLGNGSNAVSVPGGSSLDISDLTDINVSNSNITGLVAGSSSYTATVPTDWNGAVPTTVQEAIDRIVAAVKAGSTSV